MRPSPCFSLEGVEYTYGGAWRLVIPSLEVDRGETLAVIGPTGSGKSTLLRLLHFLERPASGGLWF
ncbi:MAG TPA: ATP-binding cassette domain-containing protein, partial [Desulfurivibrionaceae bacterium]|nr:ATP-binding cassette domain-containing protein [Desulfurivibrionaceae bacterium]